MTKTCLAASYFADCFCGLEPKTPQHNLDCTVDRKKIETHILFLHLLCTSWYNTVSQKLLGISFYSSIIYFSQWTVKVLFVPEMKTVLILYDLFDRTVPYYILCKIYLHFIFYLIYILSTKLIGLLIIDQGLQESYYLIISLRIFVKRHNLKTQYDVTRH